MTPKIQAEYEKLSGQQSKMENLLMFAMESEPLLTFEGFWVRPNTHKEKKLKKAQKRQDKDRTAMTLDDKWFQCFLRASAWVRTRRPRKTLNMDVPLTQLHQVSQRETGVDFPVGILIAAIIANEHYYTKVLPLGFLSSSTGVGNYFVPEYFANFSLWEA